jgi:hypothetical protein
METLAHFRILLEEGIGGIKMTGHRLLGEDLEIASKLLAKKSECIILDKEFSDIDIIKYVLSKLSSCRIEVNKPNVNHSFLILSYYEITSEKVVFRLNDAYKEMFSIS